MSCQAVVVGPAFCGLCGARLPRRRIPSASAVESLARYHQRWVDLLGPGAGVSRQREAAVNQFKHFLVSAGEEPDLRYAFPLDLVQFLISREDNGNTAVHRTGCPDWRRTGREGVARGGCPVRASAVSLATTLGLLQGAFRDAGFTGPWNPDSRTGNPAASAEVKRFLAAVRLQQATAGVVAAQSPLLAHNLFATIILAASREASKAAATCATPLKRHRVRVAADRDALLYALLWHTGLRAADALRISLEQLSRSTVGSSGGWRLDVRVTKTARDRRDRRSLFIPDEPSSTSFASLLKRFYDTLADVGLQKPAGEMFRNVTPFGQLAWAKPLIYAVQSNRFSKLLRQCGLSDRVKLHSYHGSRARHDLDAGIPVPRILQTMDWTLATFEHYVKDRELLTLDFARELFALEQADPAGAADAARRSNMFHRLPPRDRAKSAAPSPTQSRAPAPRKRRVLQPPRVLIPAESWDF